MTFAGSLQILHDFHTGSVVTIIFFFRSLRFQEYIHHLTKFETATLVSNVALDWPSPIVFDIVVFDWPNPKVFDIVVLDWPNPKVFDIVVLDWASTTPVDLPLLSLPIDLSTTAVEFLCLGDLLRWSTDKFLILAGFKLEFIVLA